MNHQLNLNEPITLRELSKHLNLSVSTVSRALNGHGKFKASTVARIKSEAQRLNYFPNANATSLRSKRCERVGLIIEDCFPTSAIAQLDAIMNSRQLVMTVAVITTKRDWHHAYLRLMKSGVDGVITFDCPIDGSYPGILNIDSQPLDSSLKRVISDFFRSIINEG